jgi:hypothetical protein
VKESFGTTRHPLRSTEPVGLRAPPLTRIATPREGRGSRSTPPPTQAGHGPGRQIHPHPPAASDSGRRARRGC